MNPSMDTNAAAEVLARLPGLRELPAASLAQLASQFEPLTADDGELVCREGTPAEALFVLAEGTVQVLKRSTAGTEHAVATLKAPCIFGHVGVLASSDRTASIQSQGPVTLLAMTARRARVILRTGEFEVASPFRRALIVAMCKHLATATSAVASLAVDANVAEEWREGEEEDDSDASILPDDAEERLLKGLAQV